MSLKYLKKNQNKFSSQKTVFEETQQDNFLGRIFKKGVSLAPNREMSLRKGLKRGKEQFEFYNESRLKLSFDSFDEQMRKALYEIIFLLDQNIVQLKDWKYNVDNPAKKDQKKTCQAQLYLEGTPAGVQGIDKLSGIFSRDYHLHIKETFGHIISTTDENIEKSVCGIFSIGSIGTIAHKSYSSDLDLQVVFSHTTFSQKKSSWSDSEFKFLLNREKKYLEYLFKKKFKPAQPFSGDTRRKIREFVKNEMEKLYPFLVKYFSRKAQNSDFKVSEKAYDSILEELLKLLIRSESVGYQEFNRGKEQLFYEKVRLIETYINNKYPDSEIHLFPSDVKKMKAGQFSSTLESKESSGAAYEKILNFETLMPGVYFTPVIPAHFLFSKEINNSPATYQKLINYIRFGLINSVNDINLSMIIDQGSTPTLNEKYIAKHSGAIYWEAFKGSSGNLPKATINLLRYEMLLTPDINQTIIQLVKNPFQLDPFISPQNKDKSLSFKEYEQNKEDPLSIMNLLEIEDQFPLLVFDPAWIRYKVLKIGFMEHHIPELSQDDYREISNNLDLSFALHVRLSDIFNKPENRETEKKFRQNVLKTFFEKAFPTGSKRRHYLRQIFNGNVQTVNSFEKQLRSMFKKGVERCRKKIKLIETDNEKKINQEFKIWYHYYLKYFEPAPGAIQKTILHHLKSPRGKLQISFESDRFFFRSLVKEANLGNRFRTTNLAGANNEAITLLEEKNFTKGLVYCILNEYYGVKNPGTIKEQKTILEFDRKNFNLGNNINNQLAFVGPSEIESISQDIISFFPKFKLDYKACVEKKRKINDVFIFLNLMEFGRISFVYRDNLATLYSEELSLSEMQKNAFKLSSSDKKLFTSKELQNSIKDFFTQKGLKLDDINLKLWVNPNSIQEGTSSKKNTFRKSQLSNKFMNLIEYIAKDINTSNTVNAI